MASTLQWTSPFSALTNLDLSFFSLHRRYLSCVIFVKYFYNIEILSVKFEVHISASFSLAKALLSPMQDNLIYRSIDIPL